MCAPIFEISAGATDFGSKAGSESRTCRHFPQRQWRLEAAMAKIARLVQRTGPCHSPKSEATA